MVKELENKNLLSQGPVSLKNEDIVVTDKAKVADLLNKHFIRASNLFENHVPRYYINKTRHIRNIQTILPFSFSLQPVNKSQVWHELHKLNSKKPAGLDTLDPFFFKVGAPIISEPLTYIFNLSITTAEIPKIWKVATVSPVYKSGDKTDPNSYGPIQLFLVLQK